MTNYQRRLDGLEEAISRAIPKRKKVNWNWDAISVEERKRMTILLEKARTQTRDKTPKTDLSLLSFDELTEVQAFVTRITPVEDSRPRHEEPTA